MRGAIVINGYLNGPKFREPADMITAAGSRQGIEMDTFQNTDLTAPVGDADALAERLGDVDFIVFWDKDFKLAKNLEVCGYPVINCSECIRICDDKSLTHLALAEYGIPSVRTVTGPMTFGYPYGDWLDKVKDTIGFPMVVKDCFGSFGEQVHMIRNVDDLKALPDEGVPRIFQEYVECDARDIRIEVVGERAVAAVMRTAAYGDFRANASSGGIMEKYDPTEEERQIALEAAAAVQADVCGVDILQTEDGPIVCEVNSNAHIKNLMNATGVNAADHIIEYIKELIL